MELLAAQPQTPEKPIVNPLRRFTRWLGSLGYQPPQEEAVKLEPKTLEERVDVIFDAAIARVEEEEKYLAGGEYGRVTPALVLGPQRYPPLEPIDYDALPLTIDPDYGEVAKLIDEMDRRDGFDGRPVDPRSYDRA